MHRLRMLLVPLLLAALALFPPGEAGAATARFDGTSRLDWPKPPAHVLSVSPIEILRTLPRVQLLMAEVTVLPSGRTVVRPAPAPRHSRPPRPRPDTNLIVLPLPASMPLFLAALAGLAIAGRRRRLARRPRTA